MDYLLCICRTFGRTIWSDLKFFDAEWTLAIYLKWNVDFNISIRCNKIRYSISMVKKYIIFGNASYTLISILNIFCKHLLSRLSSYRNGICITILSSVIELDMCRIPIAYFSCWTHSSFLIPHNTQSQKYL